MSHIILVELAAFVLFFWGINASKNGPGRILEYVMIFFYGLILEELDMRIFKTYHYSTDFIFTIWKAPLSIALLWAVILGGAMAISDKLGLPTAARPFLDAILAVWIDLSLDAIAIRMKYWTWIIPLNEGWFGVPAGNLYAWMWVAFSYSALARVLRNLIQKNKNGRWVYLFLPALAYVSLFVTMSSVGTLGRWAGLRTQNERLWIFWIQFILFALIVLASWKKSERNPTPIHKIWMRSRFLIHIYFIAAYFFTGMYGEAPAVGVIAFAILILEQMFLHRWVTGRTTPLARS